jgi:hypothetical protein
MGKSFLLGNSINIKDIDFTKKEIKYYIYIKDEFSKNYCNLNEYEIKELEKKGLFKNLKKNENIKYFFIEAYYDIPEGEIVETSMFKFPEGVENFEIFLINENEYKCDVNFDWYEKFLEKKDLHKASQ